MRLRFLPPIVCSAVAFATGCSTEPEQPRSAPAPQAVSPEPSLTVEDGFALLSLDDFDAFSEKPDAAAETWSERDGAIHCTGRPRGYIYTRDRYRNFTLRAEFRYPNSAGETDPEKLAGSNTGFLIYVPDEHQRWPASLEVQGKFSEMGQIKSNGRDIAVAVHDDEAARQAARRPAEEWNQIEVRSRDGAITATLNGKVVCTSEPTQLTEGHIGLQSELYEVEFRNLRIRSDGEP